MSNQQNEHVIAYNADLVRRTTAARRPARPARAALFLGFMAWHDA